ncbi:MAG TPA: ORF6N domain-containing protein [Blastocatellia bacterium]|nr:ORF6N domain-containing protein [Blastocatellia bacterium]
MPRKQSSSLAVQAAVPMERIAQKIYLIRDQKILLDSDLAELYEVETKALNQAVRRNQARFPEDFMFQLSWEEAQELLRSQNVTLKRGQHLKYRPYVFTEQGIAMLSSVLRSERAVEVNIAIMRTFVKMREMMTSHAELARKIEAMEKKYDEQFQEVFTIIKKMLIPLPSNKITGFIGSRKK